MHRFTAFVLSNFTLIALWVCVGLDLFGGRSR
jgi:hypothetical protein